MTDSVFTGIEEQFIHFCKLGLIQRLFSKCLPSNDLVGIDSPTIIGTWHLSVLEYVAKADGYHLTGRLSEWGLNRWSSHKLYLVNLCIDSWL